MDKVQQIIQLPIVRKHLKLFLFSESVTWLVGDISACLSRVTELSCLS